jgi:hypothetical protein
MMICSWLRQDSPVVSSAVIPRGKHSLIRSSANIIDEIETKGLGALAYFYFTFRRTERQDLRDLLYSLLTQLVRRLIVEDERQRHHYRLPRAFHNLYDSCVLGSEPKIEELRAAFVGVLAESKATYIVIDALDECPLRKERRMILQLLAEISQSAPNSTHILVTSRREEDMKITMHKISLSVELTIVPIQNQRVDDDIRKHVQAWVEEESPYNGWAPEVNEEVISSLSRNANGVFKWVECQLVTLGPKARGSDVLKSLKQLPKNLDETYARMLSQIEATGCAKEAYAVLHWLAYSNRPLKLSEAAEISGFAFKRNSSFCTDYYPVTFEPNNRLPIQRILSQLVIVSDSEGEITFAHFSVKEYLECDRVDIAFRIHEDMAHRFMLESCLVYILHYVSISTAPLDVGDLLPYPLLMYACQYWPGYARTTFSSKVETSHTDELMRKLFQGDGTAFIVSLKIMASDPHVKNHRFYTGNSFASPAWFFAYHDLEHALQIFGKAADEMDLGLGHEFDGSSPLHLAARKGHSAVAAVLLQKGAKIATKDGDGGTALHVAAYAGQEGVARLLVDKGADITARDLDGRTPLHRAAKEGHEPVLSLLIDEKEGAYLETRDVYGLTALHLAVRVAEWRGASSESIVKVLLEAGANPDPQSWSGKRAIQEAADSGQADLLELMKSYGASSAVNDTPQKELNDPKASESDSFGFIVDASNADKA